MVIDKGLGLRAFEDMLDASGEHIDLIKLGFGTSPLYPPRVLARKIALARAHGVDIMPGGTFLEVAVQQNETKRYFEAVIRLGYTAMEVSDGTIDLDRGLRSDLIREGVNRGLMVVTEYGKKRPGSRIDVERLIETIRIDAACGAALITVEGRESGVGVGFYNEKGRAEESEIEEVVRQVRRPNLILWETPLKSQQVQFLNLLGPDVNLGNIAPEDVLSLEALRRGLRSDTFGLGCAAGRAKLEERLLPAGEE
jgi:phosphosulfolactate synthase